MSKADHIPTTDDPAILRAILSERDVEIDRLQYIIVAMQRHCFGKKAETLPTDQLLLALEDVEQVEAEGLAREEAADETKREARARTRRTNRGSLPAHLPRIERLVDIAEKTCPCCRGMLHVMGEDVSERLDIIPAQFRVIVTRRLKYACLACEEVVVQASAAAPHRRRHPDRGYGRPRPRRQICGPPAALPSGADCPAGRTLGSINARRLGGEGRLPPEARPRTIV